MACMSTWPDLGKPASITSSGMPAVAFFHNTHRPAAIAVTDIWIGGLTCPNVLHQAAATRL